MIKDYFKFTNGERKAFIIVFVVVLLIALAPLFLFNGSPKHQTDFTLLENLEVNDTAFGADARDEGEQFQDYPERTYNQNRFQFNPNTASAEELKKLGFKTFIAERIVKFRNAGGRFKVKSDLYKIYGINAGFVESLLPYIDLPEQLSVQVENIKAPSTFFKPVVPAAIDLNTVDTIALNRLRGIGNKLSQRIVNFREKLGGFYSLEQLNEVYGLNLEIVESIKPRFNNQLKPFRLININTITAEELGQHPYVKKRLAQIIVNYRTQHGAFKSIDELLNVKVLDEKTFEKLKNYLIL